MPASLVSRRVGRSVGRVVGCLAQLEKNGKLSPTSPTAATVAEETAANERNTQVAGKNYAYFSLKRFSAHTFAQCDYLPREIADYYYYLRASENLNPSEIDEEGPSEVTTPISFRWESYLRAQEKKRKTKPSLRCVPDP